MPFSLAMERTFSTVSSLSSAISSRTWASIGRLRRMYLERVLVTVVNCLFSLPFSIPFSTPPVFYSIHYFTHIASAPFDVVLSFFKSAVICHNAHQLQYFMHVIHNVLGGLVIFYSFSFARSSQLRCEDRAGSLRCYSECNILCWFASPVYGGGYSPNIIAFTIGHFPR